MKTIFLTFDIDFTNYFSGELFDEINECFEILKDTLSRHPKIKTTWFIRIDSQIEKVFGKADHFLLKHKNRLDWLKDNGHEIGWHHHAYKYVNGAWAQDTDELKIAIDLEKYGKVAIEHKILISRMGWGFHTNKTMKALDKLGFFMDSSAIPRPQYDWELSVKDWSRTLQAPYFPSVTNYQVAGNDNLNILQVPINTVKLSLPTDTEEDVMRYINPAYHSRYFTDGLDRFFQNNDMLVMVCHPYELMNKHKANSPLLSFDLSEFEKNLSFIEKSNPVGDLLKTIKMR